MTHTPTGGLGHAGPIRVVLADDHAVVRDGLRALVDAEPGLSVVGEAADGQDALRCARELKPDVVVLDLSMPGVGGAEAAERIVQECAGVRVLALTMHEERGYLTRLLRAGAAGYVLKRTAASELVHAIRIVAAGGSYVDPSLAGALFLSEAQRTQGRPGADYTRSLDDLTPREREVLRLVARGHSNKEIGVALEISVKTVETHKANAMSKLGLRSRAAVVRFALDQGWLSGEA